MRLQDMPKLTDVFAEKMQNPQFAAEFEKAKAELDLAIALADAREARNLTQAQLSEMTGIKQPTLSRIEHGRVPELPNLKKLAAALNARITIEPSGKASIALI